MDGKIFERNHIFPFTEERKRESAISKDREGNFICVMKGSPEVVLSRSLLSNTERENWYSKTTQWAKAGHKVLGCAVHSLTPQEASVNIEPENGFQFSGLLAFEDPPRAGVEDAVRYCNNSQIGILMITGDHPETARAIARDIGLGGPTPEVVSAEDEPEKFEANFLDKNPGFLRPLSIVARCTPLQKQKIVASLQKIGEIVAVTGDGVNDVPALKIADISIAMGRRGTRSAKEVSSIILTDDNFSTIVNAIREGRQLFVNLRMSFKYLLLIHIPLVLTAALVPLLGYPILYLPVHIVWLELVIHPTALFAFQQQAEMSKVPETRSNVKKYESFFSTSESFWILALGLFLTLAMILTYLSILDKSTDANQARSAVLVMLIVWSAGLVLTMTRFTGWGPMIVSVGTVASGIMLGQIPSFAALLHLVPLQGMDLFRPAGITCAILALSAIVDRARR
jgi:Ca2+-transporting ATPase